MPGPARGLQRFADRRREQHREQHIAETIMVAVPDMTPAIDGQANLAKALGKWLDAGIPKSGAATTELRATLTAVEHAPRPKKKRR